jgi:cell division ATPase FtsA
VALVDVGGGSTGVAVFGGGKIRHIASLPFAGSHVTSDLVAGLGVTQNDAERLKERHGVAYEPLVDPEETITLPSTAGQGSRQAARQLVAHIIHQRVDEIFGLVRRELERAASGASGTGRVGDWRGAPAGHVELARRAPCRCESANPRSGSPAWSTVCRRRGMRCRSGWCCTARGGSRRPVAEAVCWWAVVASKNGSVP